MKKEKKLEMVVELLVLEIKEREGIGAGDGWSGRWPWGHAGAGWRHHRWWSAWSGERKGER